MLEQRLDKWLWCARLFKTRGLASEAIKAGRVTVNGNRAKPARNLHVGDQLVVRRAPFDYELEVLGLLKQRLPAARVGELYIESATSVARRDDLSASIKSAHSAVNDHKPSKKERRDQEKFRRNLT